MECNSCEGASHYCPPYVGKNYSGTKILLALHRPSEAVKVQPTLSLATPWEVALLGSRTGSQLAEILKRASLTLDDVAVLNVLRCFFERKPEEEDYRNCRLKFSDDVRIIRPRGIVTFGGEPYYQTVYPRSQRGDARKFLNEAGRARRAMGFDIPTLVMHHPSHPYWKSTEKYADYYQNFIDFIKRTREQI